MGKRDSSESEWDTGIYVLGAFKLDHLQPVKLILFQKMSTSSPFILTGRSNFLLPQREEERKQQRLKMGKRESPNSEWDTGVPDPGAFKLDHLQPVKLFLFQKNFHLFTFHTGTSNFLLPQRHEGRKEGGKWKKENGRRKMGKRNSQKWMRPAGFWNLSNQTSPFAAF